MFYTSSPVCLRIVAGSTKSCLRQPSSLINVLSKAQSKATKTFSQDFRVTGPARYFSSNSSLRSTIFISPSKALRPQTRSKQYSTAAPSSSSVAPSEQSLTWNRFLALRKTRRRISLVASMITCAAATAGGIAYLSQSNFDRWALQTVGLDPMIALGLATFGFAGLGWLVGPFAGSAIFNVANKGIMPEMMKKEKDFFNRIKKHRVDPANSSIQNPVPDFYGEKIGSVANYRTWLRDQRAFRLKRSRGV